VRKVPVAIDFIPTVKKVLELGAQLNMKLFIYSIVISVTIFATAHDVKRAVRPVAHLESHYRPVPAVKPSFFTSPAATPARQELRAGLFPIPKKPGSGEPPAA
jgi:hypothetical protein